MLVGRFGRPGLLGLAARTAVVAGTVGVVNGAMTRRQMNQAQQQAESQAYQQEQQEAAIQAASRQASAASTGGSVSQLERLAALREQGVLTDQEFEAQKAKILSG